MYKKTKYRIHNIIKYKYIYLNYKKYQIFKQNINIKNK